MRLLSFLLTLTTISIPHIHAFTYGSLLMPSYMCGQMQPADGTGQIQPTSIGGVFNQFAKGGSFFIQKNQPPQYVEPLVTHTPGYIIATFHNRNPDFNFSAPLWGDDFKTIGINLTDDTPLPVSTAIPKFTSTTPLTSLPPDNTITLGQTTNLIIYTTYGTYNTSKLNQTLVDMGFYGPIGSWAYSINLEGLILYATDDYGNRIGSFVSSGSLMTPWAACGPGDVGIIHTNTIGGGWRGPGSIYPGITWLAPFYLPSNVTRVHFKGSGVSNHGYGSFDYTFQINRPPMITTPSPLTVASMNNLQCGTPMTNPCFAACSQCASASISMNKQVFYTCSRAARTSNVALNFTGQYVPTCVDNMGNSMVANLALAGVPVNQMDFASILTSTQYYVNNMTISNSITMAPTFAPTMTPTMAPTSVPTSTPTSPTSSSPTCTPQIVYVNVPPSTDPLDVVPPVIPTPAPGTVRLVSRNDATTLSCVISMMITCLSIVSYML